MGGISARRKPAFAPPEKRLHAAFQIHHGGRALGPNGVSIYNRKSGKNAADGIGRERPIEIDQTARADIDQ